MRFGSEPLRSSRYGERLPWIVASAAVLFLAGGLRLWHVEVTPFGIDEAALVQLAEDLVRLGRVPLAGPITSIGIASAPQFIYAIAPLVAISREPAFVTAGIALANLAGVLGTLWLGWRWFGPPAGVIAALLFATSPWAVASGRWIWQPNLLPPLAVLLCIALDFGVVQRRAWWCAATLPLVAFGAQVHPSFALLSPLLLASVGGLVLPPACVRRLVAWLPSVGRRVLPSAAGCRLIEGRRLVPLLVSVAATLLIVAPFVAHQLQTSWMDVANYRYYTSLHTYLDLDAVRYALVLATGLFSPRAPSVPPFDRAFPAWLLTLSSAAETVLLAGGLIVAALAVLRANKSAAQPSHTAAHAGRQPPVLAQSSAAAAASALRPEREPWPRPDAPADAARRPPGDVTLGSAAVTESARIPRRGTAVDDSALGSPNGANPRPDVFGASDSRATRLRAAGLVLWLVLPILFTLRHAFPIQPHYLLVVYPAPFLLIGAIYRWLSRPALRRMLLSAVIGVAAIQSAAMLSAVQQLTLAEDGCYGTTLRTASDMAQDTVAVSSRAHSPHAVVERNAADAVPTAYLLRDRIPEVDLAGAGAVGLGNTAIGSNTPVGFTGTGPTDVLYANGVRVISVAYAPQADAGQRVHLGVTWTVGGSAPPNRPLVWNVRLTDANQRVVFDRSGMDHLPGSAGGQPIASWFSIDAPQELDAPLAAGAYTVGVQLVDAFDSAPVPFAGSSDTTWSLGPIVVPAHQGCGA